LIFCWSSSCPLVVYQLLLVESQLFALHERPTLDIAHENGYTLPWQ
jgi:hypothetical protein